MGQSQSTSQLNQQSIGQIHIEVDKTQFQSGEKISGQVLIDLNVSLKATCLVVMLQGIEETLFSTPKQYNEKHLYQENQVQRKGYNKFHELTTEAYQFSQGKEDSRNIIGQWKLPFQISIADYLPSSFNYQDQQNCKCQIKYILTAYILESDSKQRLLTTQEIEIFQKINQVENITYQAQEYSNPLICFCCLSGQIEMQAQLDKRVYDHLEEIKLILNCDASRSFMKVSRFIVKLQGKLTMRSNKNQQIEKVFDIYSQFVSTEKSKIENKLVKLRIPKSAKIGALGLLVQYQNLITILPVMPSLFSVKSNTPLEIPFFISSVSSREKQNTSNQSNLQMVQLQKTNTSNNSNNQLDQIQQQNIQMPIPMMVNPQQNVNINNNHYTPQNIEYKKQPKKDINQIQYYKLEE
ncbi:arrestin (macronuclear) [Tetrahymena thermophila SB210]|uniref:Arrestin n=1 Tax=Tetrahymena thermophila (strain SB210) TaxID=312017 RepID=Q22BC1_TETTS|nr:arrestin [Tetrahymena thermophila SB210]EAR82587.1 arrestin [Tetrahymena thermophila SB210]|eukprot:XP_001030250.1 arrestin [Tetrahymena thermophila SB210]